MTTIEALEYCKRFDDPKLQAQMGTDFSRATGTVGALLALRAALAERDAKIRELDAWLTEKGEAQSDQFGNYGDSYREGKADAYDAAGTKLRRLGLITEEQP